MPFSLIEQYQRKILELLDSIVVKNKYKYIVVDQYTSKLIDNVFQTNDILRHDVSAIERIEERRQSRGTFEAVYILSPKDYVVDCLLADFSLSPTRYGAAHIFFVPMFDEAQVNKIYNSPVAPYIRCCVSLMIDYLPQQANVFTLGNSDALPIFYNPGCLDLVVATARRTARSLVGVCVTLGEYPLIRFLNPPVETHMAYTLPYMIAKELQEGLDEYARANRDFPTVEPDRPQSVFLVLDRSVDLDGPYLHEFSYEAMAHDLLFIENGNKYTYARLSQDGEQEDVVGVLSEKDPVWASLRHKYIADAIDEVKEKIVKFTEENSQFANLDNASASQLKDVLLTMNVFSKEKEMLSLHMSMTETITELFNRTRLSAIADVEQCLATALTPEGKPPKTVLEELVPLLDDEHVSTRDRVRIIALYLLYREGIVESDFAKLCKHAKLSSMDMHLIRNMDLLGAKIFKESPKDRRPPKKGVRAEIIEAETQPFTRYVPRVKDILGGVVNNTLDLELFKHFKDQPIGVYDSMPAQSVVSATPRRNRAFWHDRSTQVPAQRIFVFVAGGMTYAEIRAAYEVSNAHNKEVIIGSDNFLTPTDWLHQLSRLRTRRRDLGLVADQPDPEMPPSLLERDPPPQQHIVNQGRNGKPLQSAPGPSVPSTAPHKLSRNTDHHHHKTTGNPPGHFDVEAKKKGKLGKLGGFFK
ncbi:Sec1-like protein [Lipomyces tetrasporus]|uniref:Sec1-like protein n=1 Tax=Lipomyces tetrasporus TaxID=54092 RepID=A0AAD7QVT3_9ASCO|nr:Sec1-like protein [Lipomyces tetrasporus]KAJ8100727.1 Sec1-like protein [Lipomyces tetrasporus]